MDLLNELPQGWKWVKLGDVCLFENGDRGENYPSKAIQTTTGVPFINAGHLVDCKISFEKMNYIPRERFNLLGSGKIRANDILFCLRGSLGKFASVGNLSEGAIASSLIIVRPKECVINEFILAFFQSDLCIKIIDGFRNGAAQPNLSGENLKNFIIPLPPLPEQQRLAKLLTEKLAIVEQAKQKITAQLQAAQDLTAAYLREVFESEEAKEWGLVKLQDICQINPTRKSIKRSDDELTSFIPMAAIDANLGVVTKLEEQPFIKVKKGYTYFEENDVLFAKITPCMENGKQAIAKNLIDGFGFGTTEFHVIRASEKVATEWIYFFIKQKIFLEEAAKNFTGSVGQQRVPKEFLENTEIRLPDIEKQRELTNYLTEKFKTVAQTKRTLETQLEAIEKLPAALLKQAFSGEL